MNRYVTGKPTRTQILRTMLASFPLVLLTMAVATDIAYTNSAQPQWAVFSSWLVAGGAATMPLAGLVAAIGAVRTRTLSLTRSRLAYGALVVVTWALAVVNGLVHSRDGWTSVVPTGLKLSVITAVLVSATNWICLGRSRQMRATGA